MVDPGAHVAFSSGLSAGNTGACGWRILGKMTGLGR